MLLDNFTRAVGSEQRKASEQEELARMKAMGVSRADAGNPLEPLLENLSRYKSEVRCCIYSFKYEALSVIANCLIGRFDKTSPKAVQGDSKIKFTEFHLARLGGPLPAGLGQVISAYLGRQWILILRVLSAFMPSRKA